MIPPTYARAGEPVTLEGYADDYGRHIVAVEFSFDGEIWAAFDTSSSDPDLSVHWSYTFTPEEPGTYELRVRSVAEDGRRSPLAATALIDVE